MSLKYIKGRTPINENKLIYKLKAIIGFNVIGK